MQSRYYNPTWGRFLNADAFTSTGQGILGNNMFAYCGNNPVLRADDHGTLFFTVLGAAIGAGVGALDAWMMGGDMDAIAKGAKAGAWSGGIAGAGVDVGVLVVASGGTMGVALGVAAGAGAISGVVGTGISTDWQADPLDYTASAIVTGGLNMVSFGMAPINGEILKGTVNQMIQAIYITSGFTTSSLIENTISGTFIAEATTWITRTMTKNNQRTVERQ